MSKKGIKHLLMGSRFFQPIWEQLNRLSLCGMNIGGGSELNESGELWVIDYFGNNLPNNRPAIVFDAGANFGGYANEMLTGFGERVELYCFEPSRKAFELLAHNLSKHKNVKVFNFGLGDKEESVTLYSNGEGSSLASIYNRRLDHFGIRVKYTEEVCLRTLDDFCRDQGIEHIDFLKLDVEGHELKVLNGAKSLISRNSIDFIQFEFGGCNIDARTFFQDFFYLLNERYRIYRILRDGLAPIEAYKETYEIFVTTNYLAISRKI